MQEQSDRTEIRNTQQAGHRNGDLMSMNKDNKPHYYVPFNKTRFNQKSAKKLKITLFITVPAVGYLLLAMYSWKIQGSSIFKGFVPSFHLEPLFISYSQWLGIISLITLLGGMVAKKRPSVGTIKLFNGLFACLILYLSLSIVMLLWSCYAIRNI